MQQTRRHILDILKIRGEATVDEIVEELQTRRGKDITAVTVRHHITCLQQEDLIAPPHLRRRNTPGRPQHVYSLTDKAIAQFPSNYQQLATELLQQLQQHLPPEGVNVILEGVAEEMAKDANIPEVSLEERLDMVTEYLSSRGYEAHWEEDSPNYLLYTSNCPYHHISRENPALCDMDMRLVASLLGVVPRRVTHIVSGEQSCAYCIPGQPT